MAWFKFIMFFVWAAAMALAIWAVEVGRMFARRVKKEAERRAQRQAEATDEQFTWPSVAVILPIKGVDADTHANVQALLHQYYPPTSPTTSPTARYRLLFAVESADDPVLPLLQNLTTQTLTNNPTAPASIDTLIAGIATTRGQKIHNQLAAVARTTDADEVLVFLDADARPTDGWLRDLVRPLVETGHDQIGATTGFRFYVPMNAALPNAMVSVINAAVAALLGPGWRNIAWGGSMALRRADFFAFGVQEAWQHALSDDYVLSWCVKNKSKRKIQFVQGCLVASEADFSWAGFWEFAARQYRITKVCAPGVWLAAATAAKLYLLGMLYTFVFFWLSVTGIVPKEGGGIDWLLAVMCLALYGANVIRGWYLLEGGIAALPDQAEKLKRARFWYTLGYPLTLLVNLIALTKSAWGRTIEWRGTRYHMKNRLETIVQPSNPTPARAPKC